MVPEKEQVLPIDASTELTARADRLVQLLREHAAWSEEHRRLHDEVIEGLADAGVFKMRVPSGTLSPGGTAIPVPGGVELTGKWGFVSGAWHSRQRIARDIPAIGTHALIHPETGFETYGRVLCGLEPNSLYL